MGFTHKISAWYYPYKQYNLVQAKENELAWIKKYYKRAREYSYYESRRPMSTRRALVVSNSFGAGVARHLAPGFQSLLQININHLQDNEYPLFFSDFIDHLRLTDIIFIFHDHEFISGSYLKRISQTLLSGDPVD